MQIKSKHGVEEIKGQTQERIDIVLLCLASSEPLWQGSTPFTFDTRGQGVQSTTTAAACINHPNLFYSKKNTAVFWVGNVAWPIRHMTFVLSLQEGGQR